MRCAQGERWDAATPGSQPFRTEGPVEAGSLLWCKTKCKRTTRTSAAQDGPRRHEARTVRHGTAPDDTGRHEVAGLITQRFAGSNPARATRRKPLVRGYLPRAGPSARICKRKTQRGSAISEHAKAQVDGQVGLSGCCEPKTKSALQTRRSRGWHQSLQIICKRAR